MSSVKPNPKKLKRDSVRTFDTGYLDYFWMALHEDLLTFPSKTALTNSLAYDAFATATGTFGTDAVWMKVECKQHSIKVSSKQLGNLMDSSAVETSLMFGLDEDADTVGFRELFKRAEVQVVVPKANGEKIWIGRQESPVRMSDFTMEESIDKSNEDFVFKCSPYSYLHLAANTAITPAP